MSRIRAGYAFFHLLPLLAAACRPTAYDESRVRYKRHLNEDDHKAGGQSHAEMGQQVSFVVANTPCDAARGVGEWGGAWCCGG